MWLVSFVILPCPSRSTRQDSAHLVAKVAKLNPPVKMPKLGLSSADTQVITLEVFIHIFTGMQHLSFLLWMKKDYAFHVNSLWVCEVPLGAQCSFLVMFLMAFHQYGNDFTGQREGLPRNNHLSQKFISFGPCGNGFMLLLLLDSLSQLHLDASFRLYEAFFGPFQALVRVPFKLLLGLLTWLKFLGLIRLHQCFSSHLLTSHLPAAANTYDFQISILEDKDYFCGEGNDRIPRVF